MQKIPFFDLKRQFQSIRDEILQATGEVYDDAVFSGGRFVEKFENEFAAYCDTKAAACVNSGTSALHLALLASGIRAGDEVILPANTFIATAWSVSYVGATPVFADCDKDSWQIDPESVSDKINKKTKAIIGVHLYGQPFDLDSVKNITKEKRLVLIEDCAQAHGATYKGKKTGGLADLGCFSFYPTKNLGAFGEGGAVTGNDEEKIRHINRLKNHGSGKKYYHDEIGFNMRMEAIQGAVLSVKLKYLDQWNARRKEIAAKYRNGITNPLLTFQKQIPEYESVYHLFVITVKERERFINHLEANKISPALHYPVPCHLQKAYRHLQYKKGDNPNSEYLADHCVSLPMYADLTDSEVNYIIDIINKFR